MADAAGLGPVGGDTMGVQIPPPAQQTPIHRRLRHGLERALTEPRYGRLQCWLALFLHVYTMSCVPFLVE